MNLNHPRDSDTHTIADFTEILCLLTQDRFCSGDNVRDHIRDDGDKRPPSEDAMIDTFSQLQWRASAFGDYYPFTLRSSGRVLHAEENLTEKQKIYAFLLLCANLPFISDGLQSLTDSFERASKIVLERIWPAAGTVKAFGKNETDFIGTKWERLNLLGMKIGGDPHLLQEQFRPRDTGDGGIDLVAWHELDTHENRHIPSALAQCACSRTEWSSKQSSISAGRLGRHLRPTHPWMEMIFIPHCFRNNAGKWAYDFDIGEPIVMDRLRLTLNLNEGDIQHIAFPQVFQDFLNERLSLV